MKPPVKFLFATCITEAVNRPDVPVFGGVFNERLVGLYPIEVYNYIEEVLETTQAEWLVSTNVAAASAFCRATGGLDRFYILKDKKITPILEEYNEAYLSHFAIADLLLNGQVGSGAETDFSVAQRRREALVFREDARRKAAASEARRVAVRAIRNALDLGDWLGVHLQHALGVITDAQLAEANTEYLPQEEPSFESVLQDVRVLSPYLLYSLDADEWSRILRAPLALVEQSIKILREERQTQRLAQQDETWPSAESHAAEPQQGGVRIPPLDVVYRVLMEKSDQLQSGKSKD